ncbi:MAG: VCBS repeat-containing protein [Bryobacterales bacterium]|nr:VCBS repeat-containing protein [Bryobacterales bacterium]
MKPALCLLLTIPVLAQDLSLSVTPLTGVTAGSRVILTADGLPTYTAKVVFYDGTQLLGTATADAGRASLPTFLLASGLRKLSAIPVGDARIPAAKTRLAVSGGLSLAPGTAVHDFNHDGHLDQAYLYEDAITLLLSQPDGTFASTTRLRPDPGTTLTDVIAADLDADGNIDLATSLADGRLAVARGTGNGTFNAPAFLRLPKSATSLLATDFNHDGVFDLAAASPDAGAVTLLLGTRDGHFEEPRHLPAPFPPSRLAAGDLNNDGNPDLAIAAGARILIWTGDGDGAFSPYSTIDLEIPGLPFTLADLDQDGNTDLAAAGPASFVIFKGNGTGELRRQPNLDFSPTSPTPAAKRDGTRLTQPPGLMIMAIGGGGQSTPINMPFPAPLQAAVMITGQPTPGYPILFAPAVIGGGAGANLPPFPINTDPSGVATLFISANGTPGAYTVLGSSAFPGPTPPAVFFLTNTGSSLPPGSITAISGTGQSTTVNAPFSQPLTVEVRDTANQPMAGVTVTFAAPGSGPSATFSTAVTDPSGRASATATANAIAGGPYTVNASVDLLAQTASFLLTNTPGPASIQAAFGSGQSTAVNTAFPQTLQAIVRDINSNPVPNVTVTFSAPNTAGAPGAILASTTAVTNGSGIASVGVIANTTPGTYNASANVNGVATPATFPLTNTPPTVTYSVTNTTVVGNAFGINSSGQVTGQIGIAGQQHGFLFSGGTVTDIGTLGGSFSGGWAINTAGIIAGESYTAANNGFVAMTYNAGTRTNLGTLPGGTTSTARGINDAGLIVGTSTNANAQQRAVQWIGGVPSDLGTLGGPSSSAAGVNASGKIVGTSSLGSTSHAFYWNGSSMIDIGTLPGGTFSGGRGINDANQVVGSSSVASGNNHAFLWNGSAMTDLGTLGGSSSEASGINNSGVIVGWSQLPGDSITHAFVYSGGQMKDLNGLIDPASGWILVRANSINASGQITGWGMHGGQGKVYVLTLGGGTPASVSVTTGSPQSAVIGTAFAQTLQVVVRNASNQPVPGVTVNFAVIPAGAAGATLTTAPPTDANGLTSVTATANGTTGGPYIVRATVNGVAAPADFSLTNVPATANISLQSNYADAQFSVSVNGTTTNYTGSSGLLTVNANDTVVFSHPAGVQTPNPLTRYHWYGWNGFSTDPLTLNKPITGGAFGAGFLAAYKLTVNGTATASPSSADSFYTQTPNIFIPVTVNATCPGGAAASALRISHPAFYQVNGPLVPAGAATTVPNGSVITMDRPWTVDPVCNIPVTISAVRSFTGAPFATNFTVTGPAGCSAGTYPAPTTLQMTPGLNCVVAFPSSIPGTPGTHFQPGPTNSYWTDGNSTNPRTLTVPAAAASYTINYHPIHQFCTQANPGTGGTFNFYTLVNLNGCATVWESYPGQPTQSVVPNPAPGFTFLSWSGDATGNSNPLTVVHNGPRTIIGNFFSFTLAASSSTSGLGQPVTLTATATPSNLTNGARVTFYDGATVLGIRTVTGGTATLQTRNLPAGVRSLRAYYSGNASTPSANAGPLAHTVTTTASLTFIEAPSSPVPVGKLPLALVAEPDAAELLVANTQTDNFTRIAYSGSLPTVTPGAFLAGNGPTAIGAADFDADGTSDVVVANSIADSLSLRRRSGATFLPATTIPAGNGPRGLAISDFNNDGFADIAIANTNDLVTILRGNGAGALTPAPGSPFAVGNEPNAVAAADLNNDGRIDLVTANRLANTLTLLIANTSGGYTASTLPSTGTGPRFVAIADLNNDGKLDLLTANRNSDNLSLYHGDGTGGFLQAPGSPFAVGANTPVTLAISDFNADGFLDIATVNAGGNVSVLLRNSSGQYTPLTGSPFAVGGAPTSIAIADLNGDGRADLAVTNAGPDNVTILLGTVQQTQTITFPAIPNVPLHLSPVPLGATASSGLPISYQSLDPANCTVSGSSLTLVSTGACRVVASQPGNAAFLPAADVQRNFQVTRGVQAITFPPPPATPLSSGPLTPNATATSGLNVTYLSLSPTVCTVSGSTITLKTTGTCRLLALQNGNGDWFPASPVTVDFPVTKGSLTITFPQPASTPLSSGPVALTAIASSSLPVQYTSTTPGICTVSGANVSLLAVGTCTITANQPGNANYDPASPVSRSFQVTQGTQTINFPQPANRAFNAGPATMTATASSGLPVAYVSNSPTICTVIGAIVTAVSGGTCSITASQAGNTNYAAAPPVSRTFQITPASQTISWPPIIPYREVDDGPFTVSATATSGLPVSFTSNSPTICTVTGSTVTLLAVGTCSITAAQPGSTNYLPATPITRTVNITLATQTITFPNPGPQTRANSPLLLTATASSGLPVTISSLTPANCSVSGFTATLLGSGPCNLRATQPGNTFYAPAPQVTRSFTITTVTPSLTLTASASSITFGANLTLTVAVTPSNASGTITLYDGATVFASAPLNASGQAQLNTALLTPGTHVFRAYYPGWPGYYPSFSTNVTVNVVAAPLTSFVSAGTALAVGNFPFDLTSADFNGDGKLDVVIANANSSDLSMYYGNGNATFSALVTIPVNSPRRLAVADFNGDGRPDLAVSSANNNLEILLNAGGSGFTAHPPINAGTAGAALAVADFNRDGKADIAFPGSYGGNNVRVFLGDGAGGFTQAAGSPFNTGNTPLGIAVADFNADGSPDIVTTNYGSNNLSVLQGIGNGNFQPRVNYGTGITPEAVSVGDFNNDGKTDIIAGSRYNSTLTLLLGNGSGSFSPAGPLSGGNSAYALASGDWNGDGNTDLVAVNYSNGGVSVFRGNGNGTFTALSGSPYPTGTQPTAVIVGNLNGDSKIDLAITNAGSNNLTVLLGN